VIFFDALRVKVRDDAVVRNKAVYLALGVLPDGTRDVLGMWIEQTEGAKFETGPWGRKYPTIAQSWRRAWEHVIPFFAFPPDVRRVIYTTNALESLHMQLRNILADKVRSAKQWKAAMNQFAVMYGERFTGVTA